MKLRSCFLLLPLLGACGTAADVDETPLAASADTLPVPSTSAQATTPSTAATLLPPTIPANSSSFPAVDPTQQISPTTPTPTVPPLTNPSTSELTASADASELSETAETIDTEQGSNTSSAFSSNETTGETSPSLSSCVVRRLTDEFRASYDLDPFYTRYADAAGLPVVASDAPADAALQRVCELVLDMTMREDVREALTDRQVRFAVIGQDEQTNDIPEFSHLPDSINQRARGLGSLPAASCAEESILCDRSRDRWRGEGICVHEFAHTISLGGLFPAIPNFQRRLDEAFAHARATGLFQNTYRMENAQEYWAEGVQDWYYTNLESDPPNGVHNHIDRREELQQYDPTLYELIAEFLPEPLGFVDCYSDE